MAVFTLRTILAYLYIYPRLTLNPATAEKPNVILISVDTLAANHLGTYGYNRDTSPNIDKFAAENTVFDNAYTPVPCTAPSYASLLTGLYPSTHNSFSTPLDAKYTTLAQSFKNVGYNTAGIVSTGMLADNIGGLGRGFDTYDGIDQKDVRAGKNNTYGVNGDTMALQKGQRTTDEASAWLKNNSNNKFFLFLQYVDPHLPYGQDVPYKDKYVTDDTNNTLSNPDRQQDAYYKNSPTPEETTYLRDKYDENVSYLDNQLGKLLDQIKSQGLYDNSIIILTADHGESFDHNTLGHCWRLYDSTVQVPLIVHQPKVTPIVKRVADDVSLIDIYPTLSARLGFKPNKYNFDGVDLSPALNNTKLARESVYSMSNALSKGGGGELPHQTLFIGLLYMQISGNDRVIYNQNSGTTEEYNTGNDPGELTNIFNTSVKSSYEKLMLWIANHPLGDNTVKLNDEKYKTLQGLGYL